MSNAIGRKPLRRRGAYTLCICMYITYEGVGDSNADFISACRLLSRSIFPLFQFHRWLFRWIFFFFRSTREHWALSICICKVNKSDQNQSTVNNFNKNDFRSKQNTKKKRCVITYTVYGIPRPTYIHIPTILIFLTKKKRKKKWVMGRGIWKRKW